MPSRKAQRVRVLRRVSYRLDQAADLVRGAVDLVRDAADRDAADLGHGAVDPERDADALGALADALRDAAEAYQPGVSLNIEENRCTRGG